MDKELLQFEILRGIDGMERCDREIVPLLCLSGCLTAQANGEQTVLRSDDILLIAPKTPIF